MPKKTSTAEGSLGDGTAVKVPVSVTTVCAKALASEVTRRKSAAKTSRGLRQTAVFLDMEIYLSGSKCQRDMAGVPIVIAPSARRI
jgi:hypothetical protein